MKEEMKYIAGTFMIQADEAFLNGGGSTSGEDQNVVMPKYMWVNGHRIPYVSSQAWKRWLRETIIEEEGWPKSQLRAVGWNNEGNTSKVAGELNPIDFPEDDIFGYMFTYSKKDIPSDLTEEQEEIVKDLPKDQIVRPSTFLASLLAAIQKKSPISTDEAYIHLKNEETPLPYTTGFYNADLNAIFGIDITRIGVFDNLNALELNPNLIDDAFANEKIEILKPDKPKKKRALYIKKDIDKHRKDSISALLKGIAYLRGGSKMAQFGTDISPKVIICAGLSIRTPIFSNLFEFGESKPVLNIELINELIDDYSDRLQTPVFIGLRTNYLENEDEIKKLKNKSIKITTPIKIYQDLAKEL